MKVAKYIVGGILSLIGAVALVSFDSFKDWFLFLSPDRDVTSFMWQLMQICLVSLGPLGVIIMLSDRILMLLGRLDRVLISLDRKAFLIRFLALALMLRTAVVFLMPFNLWQDFECYDELGRQWAADGDYYNGDHLTAYWPPGYPFFLSRLYLLFGHEPFVGALANVFLGTAIVWLSYLIVKRAWSEREARWTLLFMAVFPSQLFFTSVLASEMLFTPLLLAAILLFMKGSSDNRWWLPVLAGGIVLGLATLTRSVAELYLVPIAIYWLMETRSLKQTAVRSGLALIGFVVVITPWIIRNHHAVGHAGISTNTGINLFIGNQPSSGMGYNHHAALQFDLWDPTQEAYIDSAASAQAWEYIRENPASFLVRGVTKSMFFYAVDVDALDFRLFRAVEKSQPDGYVLLAYVTESYYLAILLICLLGIRTVVRSPAKYPPGMVLLLLTILYWTGIHFVFFGIGRFHFPIIPFISGFAAVYLITRFDRQTASNQS